MRKIFIDQIEEAVKKRVKKHASDWYEIEKPIFEKNIDRYEAFLIGMRSSGVDVLDFADEATESKINSVLNNDHIYMGTPFDKTFKEISKYDVLRVIMNFLPEDKCLKAEYNQFKIIKIK